MCHYRLHLSESLAVYYSCRSTMFSPIKPSAADGGQVRVWLGNEHAVTSSSTPSFLPNLHSPVPFDNHSRCSVCTPSRCSSFISNLHSSRRWVWTTSPAHRSGCRLPAWRRLRPQCAALKRSKPGNARVSCCCSESRSGAERMQQLLGPSRSSRRWHFRCDHDAGRQGIGLAVASCFRSKGRNCVSGWCMRSNVRAAEVTCVNLTS